MFLPPLDPEFAALADFDMGAGFGTPEFDLPAMRAAIDDFVPPPPPVESVRVARVVLDEATGAAAVTYAPTAPGPNPALIWLHGGGYVIGSPALDGARTQGWADELDCLVVSVDYRLAPEHPFPAAHDDAVLALEWVIDNAAELGVDTARIAIGGASAGGGLAAALGLAARDRGIELVGQLLFYPMLDDRQQTPSSTWGAPVWSQASNEYGWRSYLGDAAGGEVPAYAAPARTETVTGLAPTMMIVGGADRFLDEDLLYATRLTHAGVPTDLRVYAGAPHGFDLIMPEATTSLAAADAATGWLASIFRG